MRVCVNNLPRIVCYIKMEWSGAEPKTSQMWVTGLYHHTTTPSVIHHHHSAIVIIVILQYQQLIKTLAQIRRHLMRKCDLNRKRVRDGYIM